MQDFLTRLTSRKFLLALFAAGTAVVQFSQGGIDGNALVVALTALTAAYGVAEGIADAGRGNG